MKRLEEEVQGKTLTVVKYKESEIKFVLDSLESIVNLTET
jgi:hypothetical protein